MFQERIGVFEKIHRIFAWERRMFVTGCWRFAEVISSGDDHFCELAPIPTFRFAPTGIRWTKSPAAVTMERSTNNVRMC